MNVKKSKRKASTVLSGRTLPPSKHLYGQGESKPLIIAIIAIAAVLALSLLLLFSDRFVGKAISFGEVPVDQAGFFLVDNTLAVEESAVLPVQVNLGDKKSSIVTFELTYNMTSLTPDCSNIYDALDSIFVGEDFNLAVMKEHSCDNGLINFTYAALADPTHYITNVRTIAEITFTAALDVTGESSLVFTPELFKVYNLEEMEPTLIPLAVNDGTLELTEVAVEELPEEPEEPTEVPSEMSEEECIAIGGEWNGESCVMPPTEVPSEMPEEECIAIGGEWNGESCVMPPTEVPSEIPEEECIAIGGEWDGESCVMPPTEVPSEIPEEECIAIGGEWNGESCVMPPTETPLAEQEMEAETPTEGVKINLVNADSGNNFATKITATADFSGTEIVIWTTLYDASGKVLSIKSEKVPAGLAMNAQYTATSNYPAQNVKKKTVIVYDVEQGPAVYGSLEKLYS